MEICCCYPVAMLFTLTLGILTRSLFSEISSAFLALPLIRIPVFVLSVAEEFEARFFSCTVIGRLLGVPEVHAFQLTWGEYGLRELALQTDTGALGLPNELLTFCRTVL